MSAKCSPFSRRTSRFVVPRCSALLRPWPATLSVAPLRGERDLEESVKLRNGPSAHYPKFVERVVATRRGGSRGPQFAPTSDNSQNVKRKVMKITTARATSYATTERPEIHDLIPRNAMRILDVGCNDGGFGRWLKSDVPGRAVFGVEPNVQQAETAGKTHDGVVAAVYPDALSHLDGNFDCITFNHVLEHMIDPWSALVETKKRLNKDGCVVAVIPNIRHITILLNLVVRGRWNYTDAGLLDRTHLRFFTKSSILPLFEGAGLTIDTIEPVNGYASARFPRAFSVMSRFSQDILFSAFAVRAYGDSKQRPA